VPKKLLKGKKKVAAPPSALTKKADEKKQANPLFEKRPKNFGIGLLMTFGVYRCSTVYLSLHLFKARTFNQNGICDDLSNGLSMFYCSVRKLF